MSLKYGRVLLKMSGELLGGEGESGIAPERVQALAAELADVRRLGVQLGLVVGGGNIFRGGRGGVPGLRRVTGDQVGMLATLMNALILRDALLSQDVPARVYSAWRVDPVAEPFVAERAQQDLAAGTIVVFASGTGNPFFTTDTAGVLRAIEIGAGAMLKGTKVDGVYDADPRTVPGAVRFETLSFDEALRRDLKVMDAAAFALARENALPVCVFDVARRGNLRRLLEGEPVGTWVGKG